jgi:hypothetical protein
MCKKKITSHGEHRVHGGHLQYDFTNSPRTEDAEYTEGLEDKLISVFSVNSVRGKFGILLEVRYF